MRDNTVIKIFVFLTATIFAFITFVEKKPLNMGKTFLKSEKYSPNISPHFWMLLRAKYLIYDYFYFLILFCLFDIAPIVMAKWNG